MSRIVLTFAVLVVAACQRAPQPPADRPDHALLRDLPAPPTNPLIALRPDTQQTAAPAQLPEGTAAALIATRDGEQVRGTLEVSGRLSVGPNQIRVEPAAGSAVQLLYRLPPGVPSLSADTGAASLSLTDRSGPGGADRQLVLRSSRRTLLGEVWQQSPTPVQFDLQNGLRLVQQRTRPPVDTTGYTEVVLEAVEGGCVVARIPIGRPTPVQVESGRWVVFAEVSHLLTPDAADADQVRGGYILKAWIVPGR